MKIVTLSSILSVVLSNSILFAIIPPTKSIFSSSQEEESSTVQATVRDGEGVCIEELKSLEQRYIKAHENLETYLDSPVALNVMPIIGAAVSGGGFRAAVAALGLLKGLEKVGLLDSVSYLATLSGSTWLAGSWLTQNKTLDELEMYLRGKMHEAINVKHLNEEAILSKIWKKIQEKKPVTVNDVWGGILGNIFLDLEDNAYGQKAYLADYAPIVATGDFPIPVFTSVLGQTNPYEWTEFTPFEMGSTYLHSWIKPDAFGKKFKKGESFDESKAEDMAYLLGLFGAAYAISCRDIITQVGNYLKNIFIPTQTKNNRNLLTNLVLALTDLDRISPPIVHNFTYKMSDTPMKKDKYLTFIDAGFAINLPMQPLLRRGLNVYIICDASADGLFPKGTELKKVVAYAKENALPFPEISFDNIDKKPVSIFYNEKDLSIPTVIYIPNFVDVSTLDFDYDADEFSNIMDGIEQAITDNADSIKTAMKRAADVR